MPNLRYPNHVIIERARISPADRSRIDYCRRDHNRLGFGYQLAFVRLTGRFPTQIIQAEEWVTGKKSHSFVEVVKRFSYLRQFSLALMENISFEVEPTVKSSVPEAINILRKMNAEGKRKVPADAPLDFIPNRCLPFVEIDGSIDRRGYESAVLTGIRDEIKRGNLWVQGSKRFCRLDDFFMPESQWATIRESFFRRARLPSNPREVGPYLKERLNRAYDQFLRTLPANAFVVFDKDRSWGFGTDPAEELDEVDEENLKALEEWLRKKMRSIRLPDLLIEVDNDLYFSRHFIPQGRRSERHVEDVCSVIATLIAYAQNIGPKTMAKLTDGVSYQDILRITDWYLHEEALRTALADVVNTISNSGTAKVWGDGTTSSSDGQRFLFPRKVLSRTYSHRLGDFALEFYTFIADNYAPFYGVPKECSERDAPYVLDGLLYHEADLDPDEHYTDTHGYIELNFLRICDAQ